jgi:hypothetical protein
MAAPSTTVEIKFNQPTSSSFTLDNPIRGVLDSTDFTLGGDVLVDVTQYVRSLRTNRSKSRILDNKFQVGTSTIVLDNKDRTFDPTAGTAVTQFANQIQPRRDVVIETAGTAVYRGQITGWDFRYALGGDSIATIDVADAFATFSNQTLSTNYTPVAQGAGARIEAVLSRPEVAWAGGRDIDAGLSTLQADTIGAGQNVLNYLQTIEAGEPGAFFISKSGVVTFRERNQTATQFTTFSLSDDGAAASIPYVGIETDFTDELVYNRIIVTRVGGIPQIAESISSQAIYGVSTLQVNELLLADDAQSLNLANLLLGLFSEAKLRFKQIRVALHDLDPTKQQQVLDLELNDIVEVEFLPGRNHSTEIGTAFTSFAFIEGISHEVLPMSHFVTLNLGSTDLSLLVLDDTVFGILDQNLLGY